MARSLPLIDDRDHGGAPRAIFIGRDVDPGDADGHVLVGIRPSAPWLGGDAAWSDLCGDPVGWGGWGGSIVMVDLDARMTVAYTMNQMLQGRSGDYRGLGIVLAAYEAREG